MIFLGESGGVKAARSRFEPGKSLPSYIKILFKTHVIFFVTVPIGKSTSILLTLLIPSLDAQLSNRCYWYAVARSGGASIV